MAEFEGKAVSEVCATCKFFAPIIDGKDADHGLCKKHPRLNQKHDDVTHRTNWCQYYEANVAKKDQLDRALEAMDDESERGILNEAEKDYINKQDLAEEARQPDMLGKGPTRRHYEDTEPVDKSYRRHMIDKITDLLAGSAAMDLPDIAEHIWSFIMETPVPDQTQGMMAGAAQQAPGEVSREAIAGGLTELSYLLKSLLDMQQQMRTRSVMTIETGTDNELLETRGALKLLKSIVEGVEKRHMELQHHD